MQFKIFGREIFSSADDKFPKDKVVFREPTDGSKDFISLGPTGAKFIDVYEGTVIPKKELDLIKLYRKISGYTEVDKAVSEIVNDAITYEDIQSYPVKLSLDDVENGTSKGTKDKIVDAFTEILAMLDFDTDGYDYFWKWYVDGRLYFNVVVEDQEKKGINEIIHIDSMFIKKIRDIQKDYNGVINSIEEFFIYAPEYEFADVTNVYVGTRNAIKFLPDAIVYATSGLYCKEDKMVHSHLHKAIRPANLLALVEDAIVIYRVTRAPERRIFYVDVGSLPRNAAQEYLEQIMNKYRNKVIYNSTTGEIKDQKNITSMQEDFWLPRREGGRGTEITTLPGGENLGQLEDVQYFRRKLYDSLNVPVGRMDSESMFQLGRDSEISREEVKFSKFIDRLRKQFAKGVFTPLLKRQCILKNITTEEDWQKIEEHIKYIFIEDSHFAELKKIQVLNDQIELVNNMADLVKIYFSKDWVRKNIFGQTEEEIKELADQRDKEEKDDPEEPSIYGGADAGGIPGEEGEEGGAPPFGGANGEDSEEDDQAVKDNKDEKDADKEQAGEKKEEK
jgi:hypothetical protein